MFASFGIVALVTLIYARPQEFVDPLRAVPLLYLCFGLTVFGGVLDVRLRNTELRSTPQLPWAIAFYVWAMVTVLFAAPRSLHLHAIALGVPVVLYLVVAHFTQSFRALSIVAGSVLSMAILVSGIAVHQGFADKGCVLVDETILADQTTGRFDGRPCEVAEQCYAGDAEPGGQYLCERIGLFGTTSVGKGRIRWRGVLQDPNELALAASIGVPLAFAAGARRRRPGHVALTLATLALVLACVLLTRSRGGQLVFLAVIATYFVRRFRKLGVVLASVVVAPVLAYGGRSSAEASESGLERVDSWYEAISMFRSHPLWGVGFGQFGEYHYLTAHNSFLLTLAELGLPGLVLFSIVLYLSAKIPWVILRHRPADGAEAIAGARGWSLAMLAAFVGLTVGIFFLSFAYHPVLWIYVGLSGALYTTVRRHDPSFEVSFGWRDLLLVLGVDAGLIVAMFVLTRTMLG
jgi:O-antigen ligase